MWAISGLLPIRLRRLLLFYLLWPGSILITSCSWATQKDFLSPAKCCVLICFSIALGTLLSYQHMAVPMISGDMFFVFVFVFQFADLHLICCSFFFCLFFPTLTLEDSNNLLKFKALSSALLRYQLSNCLGEAMQPGRQNLLKGWISCACRSTMFYWKSQWAREQDANFLPNVRYSSMRLSLFCCLSRFSC